MTTKRTTSKGAAPWRVRFWHLRQWGPRWMLHPLRSVRFVFADRETTNFTYGIRNRDELVAFVAASIGLDDAQVATLFGELDADEVLREELAKRLVMRRDRNRGMPYARRLAWYAIVRARRPTVVIETGTSDGLGTTVLAAAIYRNQAEGHVGHVYTLDVDPGAGWLVPTRLAPLVTFVRGPIRESLPPLAEQHHRMIGLFIHDSDHSYPHESFEYATVLPHLAHNGILVTDNAHVTTALQDATGSSGFSYRSWRERPRRHPYPGVGVGIAAPLPRSAPGAKTGG